MNLSLAKEKRTIKQKIYFSTGCFFLLLGGIGIVIPILPTTPFLLITAFCFSKSSTKWLHWLEKNRYFGPFVINYRTNRGIELNDKIRAITFLWVSLSVSIVLINHEISAFWLSVIGICVTIHIVKLKGRNDTE